MYSIEQPNGSEKLNFLFLRSPPLRWIAFYFYSLFMLFSFMDHSPVWNANERQKKPYNNRNMYTWNDLARIFHRYIYLIPCIYRKMYIINWERHHKQLNAKDGLTLNEFKYKTIITRREKKNMNIQRCLIEQNKNYNKIVQLTLHKCCSTFLDFFGESFFLVHTKLYHRWPNKICKNEKMQLKYVWHINTPRTHVWKSAHTAEILYEINMV